MKHLSADHLTAGLFLINKKPNLSGIQMLTAHSTVDIKTYSGCFKGGSLKRLQVRE
jgi:hypothetical protein